MEIKFNKRPSEYLQGTAANVTFIVTNQCQLRCRYCYLHKEESKRVLPLSIAKKAVNLILDHPQKWSQQGVVFDFIGGEPLLEIELIDAITCHIKRMLYQKNHPWFEEYRFNISTNGLLYEDESVQRFLQKNIAHTSIAISLDGSKKKHDAHRVFPDGTGSYDKVIKSFKRYISQFPQGSTKATLSHGDLPFLKESVLHLFSLGVGFVDMNLVYEDVWKKDDPALLENQLVALADHMIKEGLYRNHSCSFFTEELGNPLSPIYNTNSWCGAGRMMAIDTDGLIYPCNRFTQNALSCSRPRAIGTVDEGIDENLQRAFLAMTRKSQSPPECMTCSAASGCSWCPAQSYDATCGATVYHRAITNCELHKAVARAKRYYWSALRGVS